MNLHEKAKRYDVMECVKTEITCEHCGGKYTFKLTDFYCLNFLRGLVYECPYCHKKFYLKDVELQKMEEN